MSDITVPGLAQKTKWWEESPGVASAKRIGGAIVVGIGAAMKIFLFFMVIFTEVKDAATANSISDGVLYAGTAILLGTIADVFKAKS